MNIMSYTFTAEESLLLKTIAVLIASHMDDTEDGDRKLLETVMCGCAVKFGEFKKLPEGSDYSEQEWSQDIVLKGLNFGEMYKRTGSAASCIMGDADEAGRS